MHNDRLKYYLKNYILQVHADLMVRIHIICILSALLLSGCKRSGETPPTTESQEHMEGSIRIDPLGAMPSGESINQYTLINRNGLQMQVINYGGTITSLKTPDRNGTMEEIVLGCDSLQQYLDGTPFFGSLVGRYGNRIAGAQFVLDGTTYSLAKNNNGNHIHGGVRGFDKVYWHIEPVEVEEGPTLKLSYVSPDMEEGYPGNLSVEVVYTLSNNNELIIDYTANTDKKTIINLTNHSYFNLTGDAKRNVLDHEVVIHASRFVPVDKQLIPEGGLAEVADTPFDFRTSTRIGARIDDNHPQIVNGRGYDHCWVLDGEPGALKLGATVYEPASGRVLELHTTEPGVQLYTGNFLNGSQIGKGGRAYDKRDGFCLETEHFPDSPNQPDFPSVVLSPGETYKTRTVFAFSAR